MHVFRFRYKTHFLKKIFECTSSKYVLEKLKLIFVLPLLVRVHTVIFRATFIMIWGYVTYTFIFDEPFQPATYLNLKNYCRTPECELMRDKCAWHMVGSINIYKHGNFLYISCQIDIFVHTFHSSNILLF